MRGAQAVAHGQNPEGQSCVSFRSGRILTTEQARQEFNFVQQGECRQSAEDQSGDENEQAEAIAEEKHLLAHEVTPANPIAIHVTPHGWTRLKANGIKLSGFLAFA
jgi:hypothetical protein